MPSTSSYAALIGIDWADKTHAVCMITKGQNTPEHTTLTHSPDAIATWAQNIRTRFAGKKVAVALEQRKGPLIYALLKYDHLVLFPLHPNTLAGYRKTWTTSGAKDDPKDAYLLAELLQKHGDRLNAWKPETTKIRALSQMVEMRRKLAGDKVRITNRITAALKAYFPLPLDLFTERDTQIFCDFIEKWPTLKDLKRARKDTLMRFFHEHNARYERINLKRVDTIRSAQPLTDDPAIIEPFALLVKQLLAQLKTLMININAFDQAISAIYEKQPDNHIFDALPGAGKAFAPRLMAAFGQDRSRYQEANDLLQYAGIAPVTVRSGDYCWVHWRYACPVFLRQTFVEWAAHSIKYSFWANAYYQIQKDRGKSHHKAVRALAFKWIRILFRCWKDRTPYDESRYLMALQNRGSTLLKNITKN